MSTPNDNSSFDSFGKRLTALRGSRKKAEFARLIGISAPLYFKWENGSIPGGDKLRLIADTCNVTVEWLLSGSGPPPNQGGSSDWSEQLEAATKLLHDRVEMQGQLIDSQRQIIESQKQTISALQQTIEEMRAARCKSTGK